MQLNRALITVCFILLLFFPKHSLFQFFQIRAEQALVFFRHSLLLLFFFLISFYIIVLNLIIVKFENSNFD